MTHDQIARLERILSEGEVEVACTAKCGNWATIEPDGDYECECGEGRLVSPLVRLGLI